MTHWQPFLGSRAPSVIPGNAGEQERAGLQPPACKPPFLPEMCELWWLMSPGGLVPLLTKSGPLWEVWEFPEDKRLLSVHFPGSLVPRGITSSLLLGMGGVCPWKAGRACPPGPWRACALYAGLWQPPCGRASWCGPSPCGCGYGRLRPWTPGTHPLSVQNVLVPLSPAALTAVGQGRFRSGAAFSADDFIPKGA